MNRFTRIAIAITLAAVMLIPMASAGAGPAKSAPKATGSVELSSPMQYMSFSAITGDPAKGMVSYSNFDFWPDDESNVWDVRGWTAFSFVLGGEYPWTMTVDSFVPTSPTASMFTGTAVFDTDNSYTADVAGTVEDDVINFTLDYTGALPDSLWTASGTIAPDGSMAGTGYLNDGVTTAGWTAPAASADEVYHYTAPVNCAFVEDSMASFGYTVPGEVAYAGTKLVVTVTDGGSPGAGNDTWGFTVADDCTGVMTAASTYTIEAGNLVVHNK